MGVALTQLIPIVELTPGQVGHIRNSVINRVIAEAAKELRMEPDKLVVRDVRPVGDLQMLYSTGVDATTENWYYNATATTNGYQSVTGDKTMGDQRWVALFGVRDFRCNLGGLLTATVPCTSGVVNDLSRVSLIKINVGGGDKVMWDSKGMQAYQQAPVAITPSAVIIPQNTIFNISYYKAMTVVSDCGAFTMQLIGVAVEPRGRLISP